ncbi:hypothetical protein HDU76_003770 [Blyttiomyces sp. JEL0837]|nr:hypothetical protein HDU76_003770 [Blyttiomyces sp. JEL0837]
MILSLSLVPVVNVNALSALPQKTNVIRIGFVGPMNDSSNPSSLFSDNLSFAGNLMPLIWMLNRTNFDPNILPTTRIGQGVALKTVLNAIDNQGIVAVIGDMMSSSTITMAVAAGINNVIHCAESATTPQLSKKYKLYVIFEIAPFPVLFLARLLTYVNPSIRQDYPSSFRVQTTAQCMWQLTLLMLLLLATFLIDNVIRRSEEERIEIGIHEILVPNLFGHKIFEVLPCHGMIQSLHSLADSYNVTISTVISLDMTKTNFDEELGQAVRLQLQYLFTLASNDQMIKVLNSADKWNMFNGDYWFITGTGWGTYSFGTNTALLSKLTGVWQVDGASPYDYNPDGISQVARDMKSWWSSLWIPNTVPKYAGLPFDMNPLALIPYNSTTAGLKLAASTCINDTSVAVVAGAPKFVFPTHVGNQTVYLGFQGDQCTFNGNYPLGYAPILAMAQGYMFRTPSSYQSNTAQCGLMLASIFDKALKSNFTIDDINNRRIFTPKFNLTQFINSINYPGLSGKQSLVDSGGDIISDQTVFIYQPSNITPTIKGISAVAVGNWSVDTNQVNFFGDSSSLLFLGNKTSPPPPRQVPVLQFSTKFAVRYAFDGIVGICSLFTLGLLGYMFIHKDMKIFKASSPRFLTVIILGANISYVSVWLFSQYPMQDASCVLFGWLKYMGFATVFGSLLLKTYRISIIFSNKKTKKKTMNVAKHLNDTVLFVVLIVFLGLWAVLLVIWTVIPTQRPRLLVESVASVAKNGTIISFMETPYCEFGSYNYVCLAAMVITLGFGVMLTYSVRDTPSAFNESKWIALALYNWVVIGIVLNAITNFVLRDPDVIFVMEALNVIITQTGVAGFLFIPKMLEIIAGRGNEASTFQSNTTNSSSGQSSLISSQAQAVSSARASVAGGSTPADRDMAMLHQANTKLQEQLQQISIEKAKMEKELAEYRAKVDGK